MSALVANRRGGQTKYAARHIDKTLSKAADHAALLSVDLNSFHRDIFAGLFHQNDTQIRQYKEQDPRILSRIMQGRGSTSMLLTARTTVSTDANSTRFFSGAQFKQHEHSDIVDESITT